MNDMPVLDLDGIKHCTAASQLCWNSSCCSVVHVIHVQPPFSMQSCIMNLNPLPFLPVYTCSCS